MAVDPQVRALARRLHNLERQSLIRKQPGLAHSSIEDGALTAVDVDGGLTMIVGQQYDGTNSSTVVTGPTPPAPTLPYVTSQSGSLRIYWDGTFANGSVAPMDFARVTAYAVPILEFGGVDPLNQTIIVGTFASATGGELTAALDPGVEYVVYLVTWSQAGKFSAGSGAVASTVGALVVTYNVEYAVSTSETVAPTTGWSTASPTRGVGEYTWFRTIANSNDGTSSTSAPALMTGNTGATGSQGIPGPDGGDGTSLFTWLKYGDTPTTGMSDFPSGKTYIGLAYNKASSAESVTYADYAWSLIKGADGAAGTDGATGSQGIPGPAGSNGASLFTWLKYADSPTTGMSDLPAGKTYIGLAYNKASSTESATYADYDWSLIQGPQGNTGVQGPAGANGQPTYTWIKYGTSAAGAGLSDSPTGATYIGFAFNKTVAAESTVATDYTWSLIQGATGATGSQGIQGSPGTAGAAGASLFTWLKYGDSPTTGMSDLPAGKNYIGLAYNKASSTESATYADYDWSLIQGPQGNTGVAGPAGANGQPTYTWIKYGTSAAGAGLSDSPTGNTYIGLAFNKTTATESTVATDYTWSLIQGPQGATGSQGVPGAVGADGQPTYTWIKYGTSAAGAGLSDDPTGRAYIGFAYNKTTITESTVATDYTWSLIQGADGATGSAGPQGTTGSQGVQGPAGSTGQSLFTWIKYGDTPTTGMTDTPTGKTYIGLAYNKTSATESVNYADYSWSLIKGTDGSVGPAGANGQSLYTWTKYGTSTAGANLSDDPTGKSHIGLAYNKVSATESTVATDYTWSQIQGNVDPIAVPPSSPAIRVTGTTSSLVVETAEVKPGTTIDYHLSATSGFAPSATTLLLSTAATVGIISTTKDGAPLALDTTYYLRSVARNSFGSAAPSAEMTGTLNLENVDSVIASRIVAGFILTGKIQVGNSTWDPINGLVIPQPDGGTITLPVDGVTPATITAHIVARSLRVQNDLTIAGYGEVIGTVALANGVTAPTVSPALSQNWPVLLAAPNQGLGDGTADNGDIFCGLAEHHANVSLWVTAVSFFGAGIRVVNKATGALAQYPDPTSNKSWCPSFSPSGGIAMVLGNYYLLGTDSARDGGWYIYRIDSAFNKIGELLIGGINAFGNLTPRLGKDHVGDNVLMTWSTGNGDNYVRRYSPNLLGHDDRVVYQGTRYNYGGVVWGDVDGDGQIEIYVAPQGSLVRAYNGNVAATSQAAVPSKDFTRAASAQIKGLGLDTQTGRLVSYDNYGNIYTYSKLATATQVTAAYTYYDGDNSAYPAGTIINGIDKSGQASGTHETQASPSKTLTISARSWVKVEASPAPDVAITDTSRVDKANRIGLYVAKGLTPTWQTYFPVGTREWLSDTIATGGSTMPISNGFSTASAAPGRLVSAAMRASDGRPVIELEGSGVGRMGPVWWNAEGKILQRWGGQPYRTLDVVKNASATTVTTTRAQIMAVSIISGGVEDVFEVNGVIDFQCTTGGTAAAVGELQVDNVAEDTSIIFICPTTGFRMTAAQNWRISGLAAGNHVIKMMVYKTGNSGIFVAQSTHTTMAVKRAAGS